MNVATMMRLHPCGYYKMEALLEKIKRDSFGRGLYKYFEGMQWPSLRNPGVDLDVQLLEVDLDKLHFSQESISQKIGVPGDARHEKSGHLLEALVEVLHTGDISWVELDVMRDEGKGGRILYVSCNNRRLAVLKLYQEISRALLDAVRTSWRASPRKTQFQLQEIVLTPRVAVRARVWEWMKYDERYDHEGFPAARCRHDIDCSRFARSFEQDKTCDDIEIRGEDKHKPVVMLGSVLNEFRWLLSNPEASDEDWRRLCSKFNAHGRFWCAALRKLVSECLSANAPPRHVKRRRLH